MSTNVHAQISNGAWYPPSSWTCGLDCDLKNTDLLRHWILRGLAELVPGRWYLFVASKTWHCFCALEKSNLVEETTGATPKYKPVYVCCFLPDHTWALAEASLSRVSLRHSCVFAERKEAHKQVHTTWKSIKVLSAALSINCAMRVEESLRWVVLQ